MVFKDGEFVRSSLRLDILQDNLKELSQQIPDDVYNWTLILDMDTVEKIDCIVCGQIDHGQTGEYPCPNCGLPTLHDDSAQL
jgi:rubrerythrin